MSNYNPSSSVNLQDLHICVEKSNMVIPKNNAMRAAFIKSKLWPNNTTIKIKFLNNPVNIKRTKYPPRMNTVVDPIQMVADNMTITSAIQKIVNERYNFMGVKFEFVDVNTNADIKIGFNAGGGAWSYIGTDARFAGQTTPSMNFGWFDVATVIHEFGHALGMIHEHQNPFGKPIDWNVDKVYKWAAETQGWSKETTFSNILSKYNTSLLNGSAFDANSVMLYFFPSELTNDNRGTQQNFKLSKTDIEWLLKNYPTKNSPTLPSNVDVLNKCIEQCKKQTKSNQIYQSMYSSNNNIMESYCGSKPKTFKMMGVS